MMVVLGVLALLLYLATLSGHYSADSISFAIQVEGGQLDRILDPTHLLLQPLGYAWFQLWRLAGWNGGSMVPLQVINALGGAVSVGLLYGIGRSLSQSRRIGGAAAAGFAVSGGLWLLSVEAEFATIPMAVNLLVLWLLLAPPQGLPAWRGYGLLLGAAVGLAILSYLSSVLLVAVVIAGLWLQEGQSERERRRQVVVFTAAVAAICIPVAAGLLSYRSWPEWTQGIWQDGGQGYKALTWFDAPHGLYAFLRSLGSFPGLALNDSSRAVWDGAGTAGRVIFGGYYGLLLLVALTPVYLAIRERQRLWARYRRALVVLSLWTMGFAAFAVYWVPGDITFWLPVLAAWWMFVALIAAVRGATLQVAAGRSGRRLAVSRAALVGFVVLLALLNGWLLIGPRRDLATNDAHSLAMQVRQRTSAVDLIVTDPDDIVTLYLVYFGKRTVLPAADTVTGVEDLKEQFSELFEETLANGGQSYLLQGEQLVFLGP